MAADRGGQSSLAGTRAKIIDRLRRSAATPTEIAEHLGLTYNAVRAHLLSLERDGLVHSAGVRRGGTRPSALYELTPEVDDVLSRAYTPFASHLVRVLSDRLPQAEMNEVMRAVGRRLAGEWPLPGGSLPARIEAASALLQELGAPNEIEREDGSVRIRGFGCLLAAAVQGQPYVCRAMESLLEAVIGVPVRECCDRGERPRCCFEVATPPA